jgi:hypothetical protein
MNQQSVACASDSQKPDEPDNQIAIYYRQSRQSKGCFEAGGEVYSSLEDLKKRFPESSYKLFVDRRRANPAGR